MSDVQVQHRRAIEALRAGVPNRDAVAALGTSQTAIEWKFLENLEEVTRIAGGAERPDGMLIAGGFGSGKSHVLEHLQHLALERRFVVSKIVISKETPLHDPAKVFREAIQGAIVPGKQGSALTEISTGLRVNSKPYVDFYRWVQSDESDLNLRFAATLYLFENLQRHDAEFIDLIVRFWAGDPMKVTDIRRRLKEIGQAASYNLTPIKERDLAKERLRFVSRLIKAAGYAGWVLLIDEVELIGRYTVLQRAKSYAEITNWIEGTQIDASMPLTAVLAITDDFEAEVLSRKNDFELVPERMRARQNTDDDLIAGDAERGMRIIELDALTLVPPGKDELTRAYEKLKKIHGDAYGWDPVDVDGIERLATNRMRQYVRAWINEWDLVRLYPDYTPETEVRDVISDYSEDADLERGAEDEPGQ